MDQVAEAPTSTPEASQVVPEPEVPVNPPQTLETTQQALRDDAFTVELPQVGEITIRKLGFIAKNDLFALLAREVSAIFEEGGSIGTLLDTLDVSEDTITALRTGGTGADKQIEVMSQLFITFALRAPQMLEDLFLLIFQCSPETREAFRSIIKSPDFDDELAFRILNGFIDLNGSAFVDFFVGWRGLLEKAISLRTQNQT